MNKRFYRLIQRLQEYFVKLHHGSVSIGVAPVLGNDAGKAIRESRNASRDQLYRGNNKVLYAMEPFEYHDDGLITRELEEKVNKTLQVGEYNVFLSSVHTLIADIFRKGNNLHRGSYVFESLSNLQRFLANMVHSLYHEEELDQYLERYAAQLTCCSSERGFYQYFDSELQRLLEMIQSIQQQKKSQPVRRLQRLIQERYREDITLSYLAEAVDMNPDYISKLFKKEMDTTLTKYLNSVRINRAKEILAGKGGTAGEIAAQVGYSDEKYFMRVFKKEEGLTLSEYRKLYGE